MKVAFLGLGRMGHRMAHHILAAGHELTVWNRSPGRAGELTAGGILETFGDPGRIDHVGPVGAASALKTVFNLGLAEATAAVAEVLRYGTELGLDRARLLSELAAGPLGFVVEYKRPMLESGDYSQAAFTVAGLAKDIRLATESVAGRLPIAEAALALTAAATRAGHAEHDFAALAAVDVPDPA